MAGLAWQFAENVAVSRFKGTGLGRGNDPFVICERLQKLEKVQRRATKMICSCKDVTYEERLIRC